MPDVPDRTPRWTPEQWRAAEAVLDTLLDLPPDKRRARLQKLDVEPEIHAIVASLLDSIEEDDDFLSGSIESNAPQLFAQLGDEVNGGAENGRVPEPTPDGGAGTGEIPRRIGPWRVLRPIGRGGMGTVHLVERADGAFEQKAAIKLLRRGLDTDDIVARFVSERQILADLDHPGIARLLDGGATEDGRPYIVMEFVDGEPIDRWCDRTGASLEERLELFAEVCDAVAYAHRNLVVHRDLKPSNILVTESAEPKVVDFGIAKLLDAEGEGDATLTRSPMWTPSYAAPEQILGEAVTTATDVWGLGAVLYRLLAGESMRQIDTPTPVALERAATTTPERPSEHANPGRTGLPARRIRGDLDAIVTTATRADAEERYSTPTELADDVRRLLDGLPVKAREPTVWYRTRKFVARRKLGVASVAAIVLLIVAYAVTVQVQSTRIAAQAAITAEERDRAQQEAEKYRLVSNFWKDLFVPRGPELWDMRTVKLMLDRGIERAEGPAFADTPDIRAKLLIHLAISLNRIGQLRTSEGLLEQAVQITERSWDDDYDPMLVWMARWHLAVRQLHLGDYAEAEANLHRALTYNDNRPLTYADRVVPRSIQGMLNLNVLGLLYHETGDLDRAERLYREALRLNLESGMAPKTYLLGNLGLLFADRGDLEAAENLVRRVIAARPETPWISGIPYYLQSLARILHRQGKSESAESLLRTAVEMRRVTVGPDHWNFAEDLSALGVVLMERGEFVESRRLMEQALEINREVLGEDHPVTAVTRHQLATIHHRTGGRPEAERLYGEAVDALSRGFGRDHSWTAAALEDRGRLQEARSPADRDWLSGTRLPLPRTGNLLHSADLALDNLFESD